MTFTNKDRAAAVLEALYARFPAEEGWTIGVHVDGFTQLLTAEREGRLTQFATGTTRRTVEALANIFAKAIEDRETLAPPAIEDTILAPRGRDLALTVADGQIRASYTVDEKTLVESVWTPAEALDLSERLTRAARQAIRPE